MLIFLLNRIGYAALLIGLGLLLALPTLQRLAEAQQVFRAWGLQ